MVGDLIRHANLLFASSSYESHLKNQILNVENSDMEYQNLKEKTTKNEQNQVKTYFILNQQELLLHKNIAEIKLTVMDELHKRPYLGHPGYQEMITMIKKDLFWPNMNK